MKNFPLGSDDSIQLLRTLLSFEDAESNSGIFKTNVV